jgi:hypothetical protein
LVVERAAVEAGIPATVMVEKRLHAEAARALGASEADVKRSVTALGTQVGGTWRAEEKCAALAAMVILGRAQ